MYYLITKEAMDNTVDTVEEGHVYAFPTNGHACTLPAIMMKNGLVDVTKYNLLSCTKYQAWEACWKHGGFRNKWDIYNNCYREDLTDSSGKPVVLLSLEEMCRIHGKHILKYWNDEGFEIINK